MRVTTNSKKPAIRKPKAQQATIKLLRSKRGGRINTHAYAMSVICHAPKLLGGGIVGSLAPMVGSIRPRVHSPTRIRANAIDANRHNI